MLLLGVWLPVEAAVSAAGALAPVEGAVATGLLVPALGLALGATGSGVDSAIGGLELIALGMSALLVADAEIGADGLGLRVLVTLFEGVLVALALLAGAAGTDGPLSGAARVGALSTAVLASAMTAALSLAPFVVATGAGGEACGSVAAEGAFAEAVFSEVLEK